jgi:hypothetical protein
MRCGVSVVEGRPAGMFHFVPPWRYKLQKVLSIEYSNNIAIQLDILIFFFGSKGLGGPLYFLLEGITYDLISIVGIC